MGEVKKRDLTTQELFIMLETREGFEQALSRRCAITTPDTPVYMAELLQQHGLTVPQVAERSQISRSYVYQVYNGTRNPSRNALLRMALAMELSLRETQRLLLVAQKGELYPRVRRDAAIIYCLNHGLAVAQADEMLGELQEPLLL